MFARVSTYQGSPGRAEEAIRNLPGDDALRASMPGFIRSYFLVDRKSGKAMTITLWESEEALRNASTAANPLRSQINESLGAMSAPTVEVFEIVE